jgi:hypothetical protein
LAEPVLLKKFPSAWIPLKEVREFLSRRFHLDEGTVDDIYWDIVSAIQRNNGRIRTRIPTLGPPYDQRWPRPELGRDSALHQLKPMPADYWSGLGFDSVAGTVAGPANFEGEAGHHTIEVHWPDIETFAGIWVRHRQRQVARISPITGAPLHAAAPLPATASQFNPKIPFSEKGLAGWYAFRSGTWPEGEPGPTEQMDFDAACETFAGITREAVRRVRQQKAPADWLKPGPGRRRRP